MKKNIFTVFISLAIFFQINSSYPCTTFCIKTDDELVFGRNYDFIIGYGIIFVNKRFFSKTAFTENNNPAKWISKYGSVTFNQFGREFPTGGMNEAGLVVELMWLDETRYSDKDDRFVTGGVLQWIQYQLDNCETVQEVIDTDKDIRIPTRSVPIHFLIADKYGRTSSIEFLNGKLSVHTDETMPYRVLANDTYERSLEYLKSNRDNSGIQRIDSERSSLNRFVKACSMIQSYNKLPGKSAVDFSFEILNNVSQYEHTKWSIVYDIKNLKIYFKTYDNTKLRSVDIASMDFNCPGPVKMLDINADLEGSINEMLIDYSYDLNRALIERSYNGVDFLKAVSSEEKDLTAKYPENSDCKTKSLKEENKNGNNITESKNISPTNLYLLAGVIVTVVFFRL